MNGLETTWIHDWPFEAWFSALLVALMVAVAYWCYRTERRELRRWQWWILFALRTVALLSVFFVAWGWQQVRYQTELPQLIVIIDSSASMQQPDGVDGAGRSEAWRRYYSRRGEDAPKRIDVARTLILERDQWLRRAARRNELTYFVAHNGIHERFKDLEELARADDVWLARGRASRLGDALRQALRASRGKTTTAVVMLTDGAVTGGLSLSDAAAESRASRIPVYFVAVGRKQPARDLAIENVIVDSPVFVGDQVAIDISLHVSPGIDEPIQLEVRDRATGDIVASHTVTDYEPSKVTRVRLWLRTEQPGIHTLVAQAIPLDGEQQTANNRREFQLDVRDSAVRVLLVSGKPTWEYRFLKQLLERSVSAATHAATIELTSVLQDADPEFAAQDQYSKVVVPVQQSELFEFDVMILLDADLQSISPSARDHLRSFVEDRGGGLVVGAGPHHFPHSLKGTSLVPLLPIRPDAIEPPPAGELLLRELHVSPTPLGRRHPVLRLETDGARSQQVWRELPGIRWVAETDGSAIPADAQVLLTTVPAANESPKPILVWRFAGPGNVVALLTDETYRWARYQGDDRYYRRFWLQLIRELGRNRLASSSKVWQLTTDRKDYQAGEPVSVRARLLASRDAAAAESISVAWQSDSGESGAANLQRDPTTGRWYSTVIPRLPPGRYVLRLLDADGAQGPSTTIIVHSQFGENAHLQRDSEAMVAAAKIAGGRVFEIDQVERLAAGLPKGQPTRVAALPPEPVWNRLWVLLLVATLLLAEWGLRRWLALS